MAYTGQIIGDKYEILSFIAQGGMSRVYIARDRNLGKMWAVKEVDKQFRDEHNHLVVQSAIAEANMIKQLDHSHIVRIVDIIDGGGYIYIVEDYIAGKTLEEHVKERRALPQEQVIKWGIQLCDVLDYLHRRDDPIIYRDMKPANVMLRPDSRDENDGDAMVIDFGIAKSRSELRRTDDHRGTPGYAAGEMWYGSNLGTTDVCSDIHCLGATLYHLVTGHDPGVAPYKMYPIRYWNPKLSVGLEKIIIKCTQKRPEDRYQSCAEVREALENYWKDDEDYRRALRRRRNTFFGVLAAGVLSLAVGFGCLAMRTATNNADYDSNMINAQRTTVESEKIAYYCAAAEIKQDKCDPYFEMVEVMKGDRSFTVTEEGALLKPLKSNLALLQESPDYAKLAYEVGKIYWYYYDYGRNGDSDNEMTRMKSAIQWFDDAVKLGTSEDSFYTMAYIYRDIGLFNKDITLAIEEASDAGMYAPYWENISLIVDEIVSNPDESEIIQLEVYRLAVYSIDNYARKFAADGISRARMEELYQKVSFAIQDLRTTSDKTEELKETVLGRLTQAQQSIEGAFRERGNS